MVIFKCRLRAMTTSRHSHMRQAAHLSAQTVLLTIEVQCSDDDYIHKGSIELTLHDLNNLTF